MQFYGKKKSWSRNPLIALLLLLRDTVVFILPIKRLPVFVIKILYGINARFVFFVHARRTEDIYVALPFLVPMRKILGKKIFAKILYLFPPFVLDVIKTDQKIDGLVVTSIFFSEILMTNRRTALRESKKGLFFSAKISERGAIFGLGGLWPMVTRRGMTLKSYAQHKDIVVTNGHCGTLVSLFLSVEKISNLGSVPLDYLKVVILGAGKMGTNLARVLYGKVATLSLIDINEKRLNIVEKKLKETVAKTDIQKYTNRDDVGDIKEIFSLNHISVCTTSNIKRVVKPEQIPNNTIIIDDSRPEGIPRNLDNKSRVVIEGGLMKIKDIHHSYDFGFGIDDNVFGCLAESFLLAADKMRRLQPTLGEVDLENFEKMLSLCSELGVTLGDFKCRNQFIDEGKLSSILRNKVDLIATIPFKNICWILRSEDLENLFTVNNIN